jgi:hypothetical protein
MPIAHSTSAALALRPSNGWGKPEFKALRASRSWFRGGNSTFALLTHFDFSTS